MTFGTYKFGPLFMRLCYELDLEESAAELIKDQVIVFWLLSLSMISFCWSWVVFSDVSKGISLTHIIPGWDFQSKAAGLKESLFICILKCPWSSCYEKAEVFLYRGIGQVQKSCMYKLLWVWPGTDLLSEKFFVGDSLRLAAILPFLTFSCASPVWLYFLLLVDGHILKCFSVFRILSHLLIFFS